MRKISHWWQQSGVPIEYYVNIDVLNGIFLDWTLITWYLDCFIVLVANKQYPTCWQLSLLLPPMGTAMANPVRGSLWTEQRDVIGWLHSSAPRSCDTVRSCVCWGCFGVVVFLLDRLIREETTSLCLFLHKPHTTPLSQSFSRRTWAFAGLHIMIHSFPRLKKEAETIISVYTVYGVWHVDLFEHDWYGTIENEEHDQGDSMSTS